MKINKRSGGFTIVELMVVVALVGILASLTMNKVGIEMSVARDARRKAELRKTQSALTTFYARNGSFPTTGGTTYSSEPGDPAAGNNGGNWIPGLAPTYIPSLPRDPKGSKSSNPNTCAGIGYYRAYLYRSDGSSYKLTSNCGAEILPLVNTDPFYDPARALYGWMVCSGDVTACTTW